MKMSVRVLLNAEHGIGLQEQRVAAKRKRQQISYAGYCKEIYITTSQKITVGSDVALSGAIFSRRSETFRVEKNSTYLAFLS